MCPKESTMLQAKAISVTVVNVPHLYLLHTNKDSLQIFMPCAHQIPDADSMSLLIRPLFHALCAVLARQ